MNKLKTLHLFLAVASSTPMASASASSLALAAIAEPNENDEHAFSNTKAKSGLRKAKFDEVIPPSDQHHRNLQTTIHEYPFTFTKVGDGLCRDNSNPPVAFDRITYIDLPNANVAACADKCATCPGGNQAGVPLLGFQFYYTPSGSQSFCDCFLELAAGATFASNQECAGDGAGSQTDTNSGTGDITNVHQSQNNPNIVCYKVEIERVPSSQPSLEPSSQPSDEPSSQPSSQTLATGCPEEYDSSTIYDASDKVSVPNGDGTSTIYTCRPFPESQLCNMYLYSPANTNPNDELCAGQRCWPQAWIKEPGTCEGTYTPTSTPTFDPASLSGCPAEYTTGTVYKAGDEVSITPAGEDYGKIYKCKDWPYTAFCNEYTNSPTNPAKLCGGDVCWPRAWTYEGGCYGTISPTPSPTMRPQGSGQKVPCPNVSPWVLNTVYKPGDRVSSYDHLGVYNNIYECNGYPWSQVCGQSGFQPGQDEIGPGPPQNEPKPSWKIAWTLVGPCTYTPPVIKPFDPSRRYYEAGEKVTNKGKVWECRVWPFTWLCHEDGYEPGEDWHGSPIYLQAWQEVLPTNAPSIASSDAPSLFPSNKPSLSPSIASSDAPSSSPSNEPSLSPSIASSDAPSSFPSNKPSLSIAPTIASTDKPSLSPSDQPSISVSPSTVPSESPSFSSSSEPSVSVSPSTVPSASSSQEPSTSFMPSGASSNKPSVSSAPSFMPSGASSNKPSVSSAPSYGWCELGKDVCFSLDASGSIGLQNWYKLLNFARALVNALEAEDTGTQFSVVTFASWGRKRSDLESATDAIDTLNSLSGFYSGGHTNTQEGIDFCQATLDNSLPAGRQPIMLLVTDGQPNRCTDSGCIAIDAAETAATNAKAAGTHIVTVFVSAYSNNDPTATNLMTNISSEGEVLTTDTYTTLNQIVDTVKSEVFPC